LGIRDRLAVLDGRLRIDSPAGGGTLVASVISLAADHPLPGASGS
jgi:signal transduction histidine kinase